MAAALVTLGVLFVCVTSVLAWTGPTSTPPNANADAPVNVGATSQTKLGSLGAYGFFLAGTAPQYINFSTTLGSTGYGIRNNSGTIEYKNSGGSWTALGGGSSQWTIAGTDIYYNTGTVGIGNTGPLEKLHVTGNILQDNANTLRAKNSTGTIETWMWPRYSDNATYLNYGAGGFFIRNNTSVVGLSLDDTGQLAVPGSVAMQSGTLSTTGAQNNVDIGIRSTVRYTGAGAADITGFAGGTNGKLLVLHNASSYTLTLQNNSSSSLAANRIITGTGSAFVMSAGTSALLQYDSTSALWRMVGGVASGQGTAPAFFVHRNGVDQTVTASTITVINFTTSAFDTTNSFDLVGDTYTPNVAGKYIFSLTSNCQGAGNTQCNVYIYKNGVLQASANTLPQAASPRPSISVVLDMNGTTDYVQAKVNNQGGTVVGGILGETNFSGGLISNASGAPSATPEISFSGYKTANQVLAAGASNVKLVWGAESIDTNSNFDTTNSRFLPTVAGHYFLTANIHISTYGAGGCTTAQGITMILRKNGTDNLAAQVWFGNGQGASGSTLTALATANGTSDYFEVFASNSCGATATIGAGTSPDISTSFAGFLVK